MSRLAFLIIVALSMVLIGCKETPVEVRVRQTSTGPKLFVDGKPVKPRFYYGSSTCLCNIANRDPVKFTLPFKALEDCDSGKIEIELYPSEDKIDFYDARLIDSTMGTTNAIPGKIRAHKYIKENLHLVKGHVYRFVIMTLADHARTYFNYSATYTNKDGKTIKMPFPYGDTLGEATRLAAESEVDFVTFSVDSSWGTENWWTKDNDPKAYQRIEAEMTRLIAINPKVLLVPRVMGNAPDWLLAEHPEIKMKFDRGYTIDMPSVSSRIYRRGLCEAVEKLVRHLQRKFPRNFAGLHVGGQNSAEWFYMMSCSADLSGYDDATREEFRRQYGKEVPTPESRRMILPDHRFDAVKHRDNLDFIRFRQLEMATLLNEIGKAIHRGTNDKALALVFYGYTWEMAGNGRCGTGETGHYAMEWLQDNARENIDGFSSPLSYRDRNLLGSVMYMSATETALRNGYLWFQEIDDRTHREDTWDHMTLFTPYSDPWVTRQILLRNSISSILRGYGDWWMDLFGRGWHGEREIWKVRRALNALDESMLERKLAYSPEVALVMDEESLLANSWDSMEKMCELRDRKGIVRAGVTYGQYLVNDFLKAPPKSIRLVYFIYCRLDPERRAKFEHFRKTHPEITIVETEKGSDLTATAIAAKAKAAGAHIYTEADKAIVEAAEGYLMVQAQVEGPLSIDFGNGQREMVDFRQGEVKLFRKESAEWRECAL